MKEKTVLCKTVPGGMTELEKPELDFLYKPNCTIGVAAYRLLMLDKRTGINDYRHLQTEKNWRCLFLQK